MVDSIQRLLDEFCFPDGWQEPNENRAIRVARAETARLKADKTSHPAAISTLIRLTAFEASSPMLELAGASDIKENATLVSTRSRDASADTNWSGTRAAMIATAVQSSRALPCDCGGQRAAELERASATSVARAAQSHHPSVLQFTVCASKFVARNICDITLCYRSASASQN